MRAQTALDWAGYERRMKSSEAALKSAQRGPHFNGACFEAEQAARLAPKAPTL